MTLSAVVAVAAVVGATLSTLPAFATDGSTFADPPAPPTLSSSARDAFFAGGGDRRSGAEGGRTITVTPDTGLLDGQAVTVEGTGFGGDSVAGILQCAKGLGLSGCDQGSVVIFNPRGNTFTRTFHVDAVLDTEDGEIDCRTFPAGCRLAANDQYSLTGAARADLGFDPDGPLEPLPTVNVDPSTDLVDQQVVQVDATGFRPGENVVLGQCPAGATDPLAECQNLFGLLADDAGEVAEEYVVEAAFQVFTGGERTDEGAAFDTIDCRVEACELVAGALFDIERYGAVPLVFDPDAPLRPEMDVSVTPRTDLVDDQVVRVQAVGYTPDGPVTVVECSLYSDLDGAGCELDRVQELTADAAGTVSTTYAVNDVLDTDTGPVDCVSTGACILVVVDRSVPIDFGRGYRFEYLDFAGTATPADPVPQQPAFTG